MNPVRAFLVFGLVLCSLNAGALEGSKLVPEGKRRPYGVVREEMIRLGWKPFRATHFDYDSYCSEGRCKRFPELLNCTGAGRLVCDFGFYKTNPKQYRIVITEGRYPPDGMVDRIAKPGKYDMDDFRGRPKEPSILGAKKL